MEEAEKKRQAMMQAQKEKQAAAGKLDVTNWGQKAINFDQKISIKYGFSIVPGCGCRPDSSASGLL
jgi:hypothetical protein